MLERLSANARDFARSCRGYAGLVRAKGVAIPEEKARAFGMLSPTSGVAAMQVILYDLITAAGPRVAGVLGVASLQYWKWLTSRVKPVPHIFSQLEPIYLKQVRCKDSTL